jgi:uncharacterized protein involved in exopolysaccharide biosynthesis
MRSSAWTDRQDGPTSAPIADWGGRPRYAAADFVTLLWRERWLMLGTFAIIFGLGLAIALLLPTKYTARSSLLVRLGQEYVYQPRAGATQQGVAPESDQVIQAEIEILSSADVKQRVINALGLSTVFPKLAATAAASARPDPAKAQGDAIRALTQDLNISTAPVTPVIRLAYAHEDPVVAARVLNGLVDQYLVYRKEVLEDVLPPLLAEQRRVFQDRLGTADQAYENFLQANRIGDFEAEKTALTALHSALQDETYRVDARLQEVGGRLGAITRDLAGLQPEVGLERQTNTVSADKLLGLRLDREALLARYTPQARPVIEIDEQIAALQAEINAGRVAGEGARRFGINPVHQTLQTEKLQLQAEAASLRQRREALRGQLDEVGNRRFAMTELEPEFAALSREKDALDLNLRTFVQREQESAAAQAIASKANDNIRIVARAVAPTQGTSLKRPVAILSLLLATLAALTIGLARIYMRRGFQTPSSASRTLDLPVLASAPAKGAA